MLSPGKSIHKKCIDCSGFEIQRVSNCEFDGVTVNRNGLVEDYCDLYPYRKGGGRGSKLKAIRKYCLWCCINQFNEVKLCPSINCELYPFRFGHNPNLKGRKCEGLEKYRRNKLQESISMSEKCVVPYIPDNNI